MPRLIKYLAWLIAFGILAFIIINLSIIIATRDSIYETIDNMPNAQAALVLGARVYSNGQPSTTFNDRIQTAITLYNQRKVNKILVSGDNGQESYDEVNAAKATLQNAGIPDQDIFLDHAGFDTYDSLYRAQAIFQIDRLTVVTQKFHLPRAIYIGKRLGIKTNGLIADKRIYRAAVRNQIRESLARIKAFLDLLAKSEPRFLGPQIPISGNGQASWD